MNKTNKKSKVDKCPSTFTQENKDVSKICILNEKVQGKNELKNGLVNGIVNDLSAVKKNSRRNKKSKPIISSNVNGESVANNITESKCRPDEDCIGETVPQTEILEDQSSESLDKNFKIKSDNIVHSIDKQIKGTKKNNCKLGKLDSNDNISTNVSCDNDLSFEPQISIKSTRFMEGSGLKAILQTDAMASSSNFPAPDVKLSTESESDTTISSVLQVADSLRGVQLADNCEGLEISTVSKPKIDFIQYESELQMPMIMKIIQKDLSEPYSIYTYRYFIHNWPKLCFLAMSEDECVGAIVCKLDLHRKVIKRGYIAMLAVDKNYRKLRIGSNLVQMAINEMLLGDADEVVLETEVTNKPALQLYEKLGFVRDKRLFRYYLNGVDALRLKLWLR